MKKLLPIAIVAVLAFVLAGCSGSSGSASSTKPSGNASSAEAAQKAEEPSPYTVVITGAELVTDNQGQNLLIAEIEYTNNTNTAVSLMQAATPAAAQDGVSLGTYVYSDMYLGSDGATPDYMLKVEPGTTTTVHVPFKASGTGDALIRCTLGYVDGNYPDPSKVLAEQTFSFQ